MLDNPKSDDSDDEDVADPAEVKEMTKHFKQVPRCQTMTSALRLSDSFSMSPNHLHDPMHAASVVWLCSSA